MEQKDTGTHGLVLREDGAEKGYHQYSKLDSARIRWSSS